MEVNGGREGRGGTEERENTLVGGRGDMWAKKERGGEPFSPRCSPLPKGGSPVMQEERGITRRLKGGGRQADEKKSNVVNRGRGGKRKESRAGNEKVARIVGEIRGEKD